MLMNQEAGSLDLIFNDIHGMGKSALAGPAGTALCKWRRSGVQTAGTLSLDHGVQEAIFLPDRREKLQSYYLSDFFQNRRV